MATLWLLITISVNVMTYKVTILKPMSVPVLYADKQKCFESRDMLRMGPPPLIGPYDHSAACISISLDGKKEKGTLL